MNSKSINIKYTLLNALYYSIMCAMVGYASIFLLDKGMNNTTIGLVLSTASTIAIFGQSIIATFLDRSVKINQLHFIAIVLVAIIILSLSINFLSNISFILMLLVLITIYASTSMLMPFINSLTFVFEKKGIIINYGIARGMGSAAYATTSLFLGHFVNANSPALLPYFYVVLSFVTLLIVSSLTIPKISKTKHIAPKAVESISVSQFFFKYKTLPLVFLAITLLIFDQSLINNFFVHIINHVGGDSKGMGNALFIQAMVELPTLFLFSKFQKKMGNNKLLVIAAIFFSIKHLTTYLAFNMTTLYLAMCFQILGNALLVPASVYFIGHTVDGDDLNKGQALLTASISLGSVLAGILGGILFDNFTVSHTLLIGTIISTLGTFLMIIAIKNNKQAT